MNLGPIKRGDKITIINTIYPQCGSPIDSEPRSTISVITDVEVIKAGAKTFSTERRRFEQSQLGEIAKGIVRDGRVIVLPSDVDPTPYIEKLKQHVLEYTQRKSIEYERMFLKMAALVDDFDKRCFVKMESRK